MDARPSVPPLPEEHHTCAECRISYDLISIADAVTSIRELPNRLQELIDPLTDEELHRRPESGGWSITEYLCHLRDVYLSYTIRLHRTRTEHEPVLEPMLNDLRAVRFRYNAYDPYAVLRELGAVCAGFCDEVAQTGSADLDRTATRLPGERRSARWLVRQAMHEGVHHLADVRRLADGTLGYHRPGDDQP